MRPNRIDPVGCACTDCLTGWSAPLDQYEPDEITFALIEAQVIDDATGVDWSELRQRVRAATDEARRTFFADLRDRARSS